MARRSGWYRLRSGTLFHGQIPDGVPEVSEVEVLDELTSATEEAVDPGESVKAVDSEVASLELGPDPEQLGSGEGAGLLDDGPDDDLQLLDGHED